MNLVRAFLAIEIPAEIQQKLALLTQALRHRPDGAVRWVRSDNIHLTLKFYGENEKNHLDQLIIDLRKNLALQPPFDLLVGEFGAFPSLNRPRVFWCGVQTDPQLTAAVKTVETVSAAHGFEPENRPFSPHLTLGRASEHAAQTSIAEISSLFHGLPSEPLGSVRVADLVLFSSQLSKGGSIYTPLARLPLASTEQQPPV